MILTTTPHAGLDDLVAFVSIVEAGSFSAAAKSLGVPKSSVSRRLANLEKRLATTLLQRTTRRQMLTDAGQRYFERCRRALAELRDAERCLEQLADEPQGVLKFTAPASFGADYVSDILLEYGQRYPKVHVVSELTNRRVDLVGEGFDVAIRAGTLEDSALLARRFATHGFVLVASPDYLARRGEPKVLAELAAHSCLIFLRDNPVPVWQLHGPAGETSLPVEGKISSNDLALLEASALRGAGIALLPALATQHHVRSGKLVRVLPEYSSGAATISVVYPSAAFVAEKTRGFVELACEHLRRTFNAGQTG